MRHLEYKLSFTHIDILLLVTDDKPEMKVQKITLPDSNQLRWIVIGDNYLPIEPIREYLFFLESIKKSPNTIRTYAHHLKIYWEFIEANSISWDQITIEVIARFVALLNGLVGNEDFYQQQKRSAKTINQIIIAISSFYQYHHRNGKVEEILFYQWRKSYVSHDSFKPLLHHLSKSKKRQKSIFKLKENKSQCEVLEPELVKNIVESCKHLRDKFLICLLYETGCRIGQALGLRHEDIETFNNIIKIQPRDDNTNHMRAKTLDENVIHVSEGLMKLYCDYYIHEYGDINSDYVFINLWKGEIGKPISYSSVITFFQRLSEKIGAHITPHMFRHTHATELIKSGWGMAHVQKRLGHRNIQTTMNIYTHITNEDLKEKYKEFLEHRESKQ